MADSAARIDFDEAAAPATPAAAQVRMYAKSDGLLYSKDDAGVEKLMSSGPSGSAEFSTGNAKVATAQTTTSTSFTDLATAGPSVTVTVGASGKVALHLACRMANSTGDTDCYAGVNVSGASTIAASTLLVANAAATKIQQFGATTILTGLTPGSTTFKMQYAVAAGTGTFQVRELTVAPVL
jgi:hypothetical protein